MKEPTESEVVSATFGAILCFCVSALLAFFAVFLAKTISIEWRMFFVAIACFFGWLSFFAPLKVLVVVMRWLPPCSF